MGPLEKYLLADDFLKRKIGEDTVDSAIFEKISRAHGLLPLGQPGATAYKEVEEEAEKQEAAIRERISLAQLSDLELNLSGEDVTIQGTIGPLAPEGYIYARPANYKGKDLVQAWVIHILLNSANSAGEGIPTWLFLEEKNEVVPKFLEPLDKNEAKKWLERLITLYVAGLQRPLPFFSNSLIAYADQISKGSGEEKAKKAALKEFRNDYNERGDYFDPYINLVFGEESGDALNEEFESLSLEIGSAILGKLEIPSD